MCRKQHKKGIFWKGGGASLTIFISSLAGCLKIRRVWKNSLSTQSDGVQPGFRTETDGSVLKKWYARGESNPNLRSRSPAFYPLKYRRTSYNSRP